MMLLADLISGIKMGKFSATESSEISSFLKSASIRLDAWFKWFNISQSGTHLFSFDRVYAFSFPPGGGGFSLIPVLVVL